MPNPNKQAASMPRRFINKYFSAKLDLRVRLFNVLAMGGMLISLLSASVSFALGDSPIEYITFFVYSLVSFALLLYSSKTGKYQRCYIITIAAVFLIGFPFFFFMGMGYYSAMPYFFVFAILFTIFMLEGKRAIFISALELALYILICIYDWIYIPFNLEFVETGNMFIETVFGFSAVSSVLGICLYMHLRLYNEQQKKLNEQNAILAQANRKKTEFFANASHEMRTPLTIASVNVQTVKEILEDMGDKMTDPDADCLLKNTQKEIMRLSRMVDGMLTLASISESTDRLKLDLTGLLNGGIEMLRLSLEQRGNIVTANIEQGLSVFGNADLLAQVLSNILQNSGKHTKNGEIAISAKKRGNEITVEVRDTGTGISPDILPRVFERGESTGGTGYGLYLCKTIVESHGGRIWIENGQEDGAPKKGAAVFYSLPFYEGQFGEPDV